MRKFRIRKITWISSILLSMTISASANEEENFLDVSLEEIMAIPLDVNAVNILEAHIHKKNEWMVGYRFKHVGMQGNLSDDKQISNAEVLKNYRVAPTAMTMEMHMASLMYAPTDDITLMAMLPYKRFAMEHVTRKGGRFTTKSEGTGVGLALSNEIVIAHGSKLRLTSRKKGGLSVEFSFAC